MRALAVLLLVLGLPSVAAQSDAAAQQAELYQDGLVVMGVTFATIALGAAGMWWVNHRYHPPGEAQRARSRRD